MISEYFTYKLLDYGYKKNKKYLKSFDFKIDSSMDQVENSMNLHMKSLKNWVQEISFKDSIETKHISKIYIPLDVYLTPRRQNVYGDNEKIPFSKVSQGRHFVLLGDPGAGKTTTIKYLCYQLLFNDSNQYSNYNYPIVIRLRDIRNFTSENFLLEEILAIYGIKIRVDDKLKYSKSYNKHVLLNTISTLLDSQKIVLALDGFDELPDLIAKENALENIRNLFNVLEYSLVIVTSRSSDFKYHLINSNEYEINPLFEDQINEFCSKWLEDLDEGLILAKKIINSPHFHTSIRPITLAHLCAIYKREGKLPEKPSDIYRKIINLMTEEWDFQRSVKRHTNYTNFKVDQKRKFLSELAYELTISDQRPSFSEWKFEVIYEKIHEKYQLPEGEGKFVINELETHSGLVVKNSYDGYEFAHKSLQEFLTAQYLIDMNYIPSNKAIFQKIPNELAILFSITDKFNDTFLHLLNEILSYEISKHFIEIFISRLIIEKPKYNLSLNEILNLLSTYNKFTYSDVKKKLLDNKYYIYSEYMSIDQENILDKLIIDILKYDDRFFNLLNSNYVELDIVNPAQSRVKLFKKNKPFEGPERIIVPKVLIE